MSLTLPQIILYNHASHVNHTNAERRYEAKNKKEDKGEENPVVLNGKRADELSGDEMMSYLGDV
jgi:hypothetical protein